MQPITTAAQLRIAQRQGVAARQSSPDDTLGQAEVSWLEEELEKNLRTAAPLAYHRNECVMQMQFSEEGLRTHLKYARQPRGEAVLPEHALNAATRQLLLQLYAADFTVYQEYENGEVPGALWSPRGPQRLMLRWS
jgi:hypothetical protein